MPLEVRRRSDWDGSARELGYLFRLHRDSCGRQLEAVCRLMSHQLGWEVRLEVAGNLHRSQVCRSQDEVLDTSDQWKVAMTEKAWR